MQVSSHENQDFINRITNIVIANVGDEDFGVSRLAKEAGMSRSKLYIKVKSLTQKSVSRFISEIRLKKASEILGNTSLTVSEVSYKVGFSSPTYFNHCFHEYFGFSPGEVKKQKQNKTELLKSIEKNSKKKLFTKTRKWIIVTIASLFAVLVVYIVYTRVEASKVNIHTEKSVIVLPFKNLSTEANNQYFADGICEDILNNLTKISDFKVVSRTSSELFRESLLSSTEIAKQMNVNYILEGSVRKQGNNVRVSIQLIDAPNDMHLWSDIYDRQMKDIFYIQSDIAKNVADKLQSILSSDEIEQIKKTYTENEEAYRLYLAGRFYYRLRTKESFEKSIKYYNQALDLDSNYCLAYAGLADTYVTSSWYNFYPCEIGVPKSRAYALKALSLDSDLAEPHATLGGIATYFDFDWEMAEKELRLSMKINPGYARAYKLYSEYMDIIGNREEARKYIDKALELEPSYSILSWHSLYYYLKEGKYLKALEESEKIYHLDGNEVGYWSRNFQIYLIQDNIPEAIAAYKSRREAASANIDMEMLNSLYIEKGKEGFLKFVIDTHLEAGTRHKIIADLYGLTNENDSALYYLEKAFESGDNSIVRIKYERSFAHLRNEPRFIALLKKMNLAVE